MQKTRPPYPPEFRAKMVELVRSGRTPDELSKEFEPSSLSIRKWVAKANGDVKTNAITPVQNDAQKELEQLRKEVRILREERDILKKAAAWFAQETGVPSSRRSSS